MQRDVAKLTFKTNIFKAQVFQIYVFFIIILELLSRMFLPLEIPSVFRNVYVVVSLFVPNKYIQTIVIYIDEPRFYFD